MLFIGNTGQAYSLFWIIGLSEQRALGFMLFPIADTLVWEHMIFGIMVHGQPNSQCVYEMGHD